MGRDPQWRTVPADDSVRRGRLTKAQQFLRVADEARELSDAHDVADSAVTLYVHAGIAAADAICAKSIGKHSRGQDHQSAVVLLATIDTEASKELATLLGMKTRAGYGYDPIGYAKLVRAQRAARSLVRTALE